MTIPCFRTLINIQSILHLQFFAIFTCFLFSFVCVFLVVVVVVVIFLPTNFFTGIQEAESPSVIPAPFCDDLKSCNRNSVANDFGNIRSKRGHCTALTLYA